MSSIEGFLVIVGLYLIVRTWLAFRDPPKLNWEFVFPPIDIAVISALMYLGNRDPLSNISLLYFFPLAQAAGTLSLRWSLTVGVMVVAGAALATHGLQSAEPFNAFFRYFFILVMGSLMTLLARAAASLQAELGIARDRNRMAMEMHDGVQGHLVTLSRQLELIERSAEANPGRAVEIAREARDSSRLAADELRYLVHRMRSPSLEQGFVPALRQFVHNQAERNGIEINFVTEGEPQPGQADVEHALFRIAQEALNNVLKYSGATAVKVDLTFMPGETKLLVKDNGRGFDPLKASEGGLTGMAARAEAVRGQLTIQSSEEGTTITALVPVLPGH